MTPLRRLAAAFVAIALACSGVAPIAAAEPVATPAPVSVPGPSPTPEPAPAVSPEAPPAEAAEPTPGPTAATAPEPTPAPAPASVPGPAAPPAVAADPTPEPTPTPLPDLSVAIRQAAQAYDAATNKATVLVTATPSGAIAPWSWTFAVRGTVAATGQSTGAATTVRLVNNCSITTQSVTVTVTDAAGRTAGAASTLDRSLCPPPPDVPHATDRIIAGPTLTEDSFVDRLRAVGSPALAEARPIYRTLVDGGVNAAFALGTFHAESHSGTRGYAVVTKNWGNILYHSWEAAYGAVPYSPGNGYTYAKYPTWLASVRAYVDLLKRYDAGGYTTVSSASAHWLGTSEGSARHLTYLRNITSVMSLLPDDAVPRMTALSVPATSRAAVTVTWSAKDNLGVTRYQVRARPIDGSWPPAETVTGSSRTLTLATGTWKIGVRAGDAAGNWSAWRYGIVVVDAKAPAMTRLAPSQWVPRAPDRTFSVSWAAADNVGVVKYQLRTRTSPDGSWSSAVATKARSRELTLAAGSWIVAVRARDAVGNWGEWREIRVVVPVDDREFTFSAGTVRRTGPSYYGGTLTKTARAGATLTAAFNGTGFHLVGASGPSLGALRVTIDGTSRVVDTGRYKGVRATATRQRVIVFSTALPAGDHVVVITNLATRGRPVIAIDGLGFAR